MRLTAAIPMTEDGVGHLPVLFESLASHGFDEVLFLWLEAGKKKPTVEGDLRVVRAHPDFVVEAALAESTSDWVFIFYPGEVLSSSEKSGPGGTYYQTLKEDLEAPERADRAWAALRTPTGEFDVRGFRRGTIANGGITRIDAAELFGEASRPVFEKKTWPEPSCALTVVLPTWRLGGLDVTLEALQRQTFEDFEVVLVDALYRWRKGRVGTLVRHVPIDDDIFPLSSHSRFRNTAIRRALGKRLVFLSDYACPPPNFLAKHAELPEDVIGVATWVRTTIRPEAIDCPIGLSPWDVIDQARCEKHLWTAFKPGVNPAGEVIGRFPHNPEANVRLNTQEYLPHWKADSAPISAVRRINGWDESFDGRGDYADVDFSLRLLWSGMKLKLLDVEVPVLDAHVISVAPISDTARNNWNRLVETRTKRMIRCVHGLERGLVND